MNEVMLPWRSFKAYVQLYDYFMAEQDGLKLSRRAKYSELMVASDTLAGERTRAPLLKYGLIDIIPPAPEDQKEKMPFRFSGGMVMVARGTPCGREWMSGDEFSSPRVYPQPRSEAGKSWIRTGGRCAYCGKPLTFFYDLALGKSIDEEYGVRFFACRRCHSIRGPRSLDEFRRLIQMNDFEKRYGVRFNRRQIDFLKRELGVVLDFKPVTFWFEQYTPPSEMTAGDELNNRECPAALF